MGRRGKRTIRSQRGDDVSTPRRLVSTVVKRLERLERMRALMDERWESTGDRKHLVRRDDVAVYVALALGEEVSSQVRASVRLLGKQLGWAVVRLHNRRVFRGVKRRGQDAAEARAAGVALELEWR